MVDHIPRSTFAVTGQIGTLPVRGKDTGLGPSEVQQRLDQPLQPLRGPHRGPHSARTESRSRSESIALGSLGKDCSGARRSVNGVRNSWLTFWKNSVLAWSISVSA